MIRFEYDDGGRAAAGRKGTTGDCGVRAAAIVTGLPYKDCYSDLFCLAREFRDKSRRTVVKRHSASPRDGIFPQVLGRFLFAYGYEWIALSGIGMAKVSTRDCVERWPDVSMVLSVRKHYIAVVNSVIRDNHVRDVRERVWGVWLPVNHVERLPLRT